jgi:hypothetical protein
MSRHSPDRWLICRELQMPQPSDHPIQPVTLTGQHVQLVPLSLDHCDELVAAVQDGEHWRLWYTGAPEPEANGRGD